MTDKDKIRNIIELFIAWNGETDVIDIANIDSAVDFISDSLQVKEVDLKEYYHEFLQKEWFGNSHVRTVSEMMAFTAKHFFELGLNASNPLTWEDIKKIGDLFQDVARDSRANKDLDASFKKDLDAPFKEILRRFLEQKGGDV